MTFDLILKGGSVAAPGGLETADIGVRGGRIARIGILEAAQAGRVVDCAGLTILPGVIDSQVHFREPGLEHKEDLASGSLAAVMGGVTGVFEMPNTRPSTASADALAEKVSRAAGRMWCDHAFYMGATAENADDLAELERVPGCCGVKLFMGASTGDLLVWDDATIARVFRAGRRRVAIHAEDEQRMRNRRHLADEGGHARFHPVWRDDESAMLATRRAVALARETRRRVHILHVTTPAELEFLSQHKDIASCEVLPQHLTLAAPDCYDRLGAYAQMNPPIRSAEHRDGLWFWLNQGVVDVLGSDHAPHTRAEKDQPYPASPSGLTGVQTLLPLMLDHVANGRLSLQRLIDLTSAGVTRLFNLIGKGRLAVGYDADFSVVDLKKQWTITHAQQASRVGWTPFDGMTVTGKPVGTIIRGQVVMWEDVVEGAPIGAPMRFQETLRD
ncbi:dihydroorotase [Hankyongella ginsenosidimutans]|uniref:Dihydroorotase n=1 Tax=Hankyongella ginsenosidimutans TaxID=1763828 RepID=A0A4D7C1L2_9SPHN|nr:dihydroorotase [Hankyongella ginsenosidimutans]QCI78921.1 dihydroorotase [Hankyongella ginsenosidimutans]